MQTPLTARLHTPAAPKIDRARLLKTGLILAGLAALWLFRSPLGELLALAADRERLLDTLGGYGQLGLVLLFVLLFVQVIVAAVPGHLLMVTGGYLYGFWTAFLIIHSATVIASQFAFWLARRYGRPVVERLAPAEQVETWTKRAERQGVVFFMFAFIIPIFPADIMNFVAGMSGLSPRKFLGVSLLGRLPTSVVFSLIGAYGLRIDPGLLALAVVVTIVIYTAWRKIGPRLEHAHGTEGVK